MGAVSNSHNGLAGLPDVETIASADMAAFDRLPPALRATIRDLPLDIAAEPILAGISEVGENAIVQYMSAWRDLCIAGLRQEMAEALAK